MDKIFENAKKYLYIVLIILLISVAVIGTLLYIHVQSKQNLYEVENGKFINSKGKVIFELPNNYDFWGKYSEGYLVAGAKKEEVNLRYKNNEIPDGGCGMIFELSIINNKGKAVKIPYPILSMGQDFVVSIPIFHNGCIIVQDVNGKYHLINTKGQDVKNKDIKTALMDNLNVYPTDDYNGYYVLDKHGKEIFRTNSETKYRYIKDMPKFSEGLLLVTDKRPYEDNVRSAYVDKDGKIILENDSNLHFIGDFHNGLALAKENQTGKEVYINKKGKVIIKGDYTYSTPFDNNVALFTFCHESNYGETDCYKNVYVDKKGKTIYEFKEHKNQNRYTDFGDDFDNLIAKLRTIKIEQETEPEFLYYYYAD